MSHWNVSIYLPNDMASYSGSQHINLQTLIQHTLASVLSADSPAVQHWHATTCAVHPFKLPIFSSDFTNKPHVALFYQCPVMTKPVLYVDFPLVNGYTPTCSCKWSLSLSHLQPVNELKYPIPESAVYGRSSASVFFSLKYSNACDQSQSLCGVFCGSQEINSRTAFEPM